MIPSMLMIIFFEHSFNDHKVINIYKIFILYLILRFLITLSNFLKYGQKAENHRVCADNYDNLITKIRYEKEYPDEDIKLFIQNIEKSILEIN